MPLYRNYFRNSNGIVGRDDFEAANDEVALTIAARVFDAVRDRCTSFEMREKSSTRHNRYWTGNKNSDK